jgi:hypothetical protein
MADLDNADGAAHYDLQDAVSREHFQYKKNYKTV